MNNNNRNKYSFAPTYGAQKKVPPKKPQAPNQQAPKTPMPSQAPQGYYQQPPGAVFPPPNGANPYQQQPYQQNQPPYQGQGVYPQPQQGYGNPSSQVPPYGQPFSQGQNNSPPYQQQPYGAQGQAGYGHQGENPYPTAPPAAQAPYGQQAYGTAPPYQNSDYGQTMSFTPLPYSPYGQDTPAEEPRAPRPRQEQEETDIVDKALQGILFIIAPLLFILTLVFSSITFLKWSFVGLAVFGLIVMWSKKTFVSSARLVLTLIYVALTAVTLVTIFAGQASDLTQTGGSSGLSAISTPGITTQTQPPTAQGDGDNNLQGAVMGDPLGEEGVGPQPEDSAPAPLDSSEAIAQLTSFLDSWIANDRESMLQLVSPKWKGEQQNPQTALFGVTGVSRAIDYNIINAEGSDSEAIRNIIVGVTFSQLSSEKTYQYSALMRKENGIWYVDPTTFMTKIAAEATPAPETEETQPQEEVPAENADGGTDPGTVLFYNPDGGSYYHIDENCSSVKNKKYLPLAGIFYYSALNDSPYNKLTPCPTCQAPARP